MIQVFPIEFIRELIRQTLLREKIKNTHLVGGDDEINIFSFYEQVASQDDVDRYVENYRALTDQQNRIDLIGNGVLVCPSAPSITNIYKNTIIPMDWSLMVRSTLKDRDNLAYSFNNLIDVLNGRSHDIALLQCDDENGKDYYVPFVLPKIGHQYQSNWTPSLYSGCFVGTILTHTSSALETNITNIVAQGIYNGLAIGDYVYYVYGSNVRVAYKVSATSGSMFTMDIQDDGDYPNVIFPPTHTSLTKMWTLSISFEALRGDTPRSLNSEEVWDMNISGSATLCDSNVRCGNDLVRLAISTYGLKGNPDSIYSSPTTYYLEPLELGSGLNANTDPYQLLSQFRPNTHTDAITPTLQYSFVLDMDNPFIKKLWEYARYGSWTASINNISPNTTFSLKEIYVNKGIVETHSVYVKLVDAIEVANTEGDTMTISATFQVQGSN